MSAEEVGRLLAYKPQLMACSIEEQWRPLVKYLYYLGVRRDGMKRILMAKPVIFCVDLERTIAPKVCPIVENIQLSFCKLLKLCMLFLKVFLSFFLLHFRASNYVTIFNFCLISGFIPGNVKQNCNNTCILKFLSTLNHVM